MPKEPSPETPEDRARVAASGDEAAGADLGPSTRVEEILFLCGLIVDGAPHPTQEGVDAYGLCRRALGELQPERLDELRTDALLDSTSRGARRLVAQALAELMCAPEAGDPVRLVAVESLVLLAGVETAGLLGDLNASDEFAASNAMEFPLPVDEDKARGARAILHDLSDAGWLPPHLRSRILAVLADHAEHAVHAVDTRRAHGGVPPAPGGAQLARATQPAACEETNETRAMGLLTKHPEWSYAQIARELRLHRSTVSRMPSIRAVRRIQKAEGLAEAQRGHRLRDRGSVETAS